MQSRNIAPCDQIRYKNIRQIIATVKCDITDRRKTIGDCYICKTDTSTKRPITYGSNAIGNYYARKSAAITECILTDRSNAVTDRYACKTAATIERTFV